MKLIDLLLRAGSQVPSGLSEARLKAQCAELAEEIKENHTDPIGDLIALKDLADFTAALRQALAQKLVPTVESYGPDGYKQSGRLLTLTASGKYDYSSTPYLVDLEKNRKAAEEIAKALCKNRKVNTEEVTTAVYVDEDGVEYIIYPAVFKTSETSVKIERAKPEKQEA